MSEALWIAGFAVGLAFGSTGDSAALPAVPKDPLSAGNALYEKGDYVAAAEQYRQFPADGEAQPGTAVFSRGAGIGLLERFENKFLLVDRNTNARVRHFKDHVGAGKTDIQFNLALVGELKCIRQQVLKDLL